MRILRFNESNLSLAELEKTSKEGGVRGDVLVKKLKKQAENPDDKEGLLVFNPKGKLSKVASVENPEEIIDNITTGKTNSFDIEKASEFFLKRKRYVDVFKTDKTNYKLNDIEKTDEFGSSGGSSLGSKETKVVESIQCLYCSLRANLKRPISENDFNEFFEETGYIKDILLDSIKVDIDIKPETLDNYRDNWQTTFITTANALFDYRETYELKSKKKSILDDRKQYTFYQIGFNGGINLTISKKYKELVKGIRIEKWNPADMWVVNEKKMGEMQDIINRTETIEDFNREIDRFFNNRNLIGVSLKKVKNLTSANLLINKVTTRPTYEFSKVRTSFDPLNSLGVNILLKQYSDLKSENRDIQMVIRTFSQTDGVANVLGEILGSSSRHGKVSLSEINSIFKRFSEKNSINIPRVQTYSELKYVSDEDLFVSIKTLNDMIGQLGDKSREMKSEKTATRPRLISKYQSLMIAKTLYDYEKFSSEICQKIMYYALAIENDQFECPKYVRVL